MSMFLLSSYDPWSLSLSQEDMTWIYPITCNSGFSALSGYVLYPQTTSQHMRTRGLMVGSELARRKRNIQVVLIF